MEPHLNFVNKSISLHDVVPIVPSLASLLLRPGGTRIYCSTPSLLEAVVDHQLPPFREAVVQIPYQLFGTRAEGGVQVQEQRFPLLELQDPPQEGVDGNESLIGGDLEFRPLHDGGSPDRHEVDLYLLRHGPGGGRCRWCLGRW
jgi:hypothetical protein